MCDDCGLNLKQRGYFFIEEQLYCKTHAKERVKPPEGYDVVAVYPKLKLNSSKPGLCSGEVGWPFAHPHPPAGCSAGAVINPDYQSPS